MVKLKKKKPKRKIKENVKAAAPKAVSFDETDPKHQKFIELGTKRTEHILGRLVSLSKLSNKNNYKYEQEHVDKMFDALQAALDDARAEFEPKQKAQAEDSPSFSF